MKKRIGKSLLLILLAVVMIVLSGTYEIISTVPKTPSVSASAEPLPEKTPGPTVPPTERPEPTPEPTPEPEPEYFTISMVGDCTLASAAYFVGTQYGYDTTINGDFSYPFAKTLQYFEDDDFTFANLECCLTTSTAAVDKTFTFKTGPEYAQIMSLGSVEFVTLANNHILDYGSQGVADTKAALDDVGVAYAGRDEYAIYETESGLKIGIYTVSFGTKAQVEAGIAALKDEGAEFIIAALHWGDEGSYTPNADQKALGHAAVDAGADFVYGSHPHTLQPVEEYNGHYIYYSMGNWTFGGNTNPRDKDTFILRLTLCRELDGTVSIVGREEIPCACSGTTSYNNYQPVPYEEGSEEYERVLSKLNGSFTGSNLSISYGYSANE